MAKTILRITRLFPHDHRARKSQSLIERFRRVHARPGLISGIRRSR